MKRVLPRNADRRFEKAFLRAVNGGRVRRHGGFDGARARSGQGDSANRASPLHAPSSQGFGALTKWSTIGSSRRSRSRRKKSPMKLKRGDKGANSPRSVELSASCSMKANRSGRSPSAAVTRSVTFL